MPTLAEVRARVETDLDDGTLQTIVDAETEVLLREVGDKTATETQLVLGLKQIVLKRKPDSITSITERGTRDADVVALASDDWRQVGQYTVRRLTDGTNPAAYWGAEVVVKYVPEVDTNLRDRVVFDLVQLSVEFRAMEAEDMGDYKRQETQGAYEKRRAIVLAQVSEGRGLVT